MEGAQADISLGLNQALFRWVTLALCRSSLMPPSLLRPLMEKEGCETLPTVWGPITMGNMYAAGPVRCKDTKYPAGWGLVLKTSSAS